ncbi:MAG: PHP domain-containing protein [Lentisphaeria bacterium]|nr:PHP domain-containing protein [Lentisphaeria bacterium]
MFCYDLHLHTEWSYDATARAGDYFRMAQNKRLRALAITDHHLMDGYGDVLAAAAEYPEVGYLSGGELTVHCDLGEFDLVCLNLPRRPTPELNRLWDIYHKWQRAYGHALSENFCARGLPLDDDARMKLLQTYRPQKAIDIQGNTHVQYAALLNYCIAHGFCRDAKEYGELRASFTDMPDYPEYDVVIPAVKKAGGVVILAHPVGYFLTNDRRRMDCLRELFSLDGIECAHESVPRELVDFYRQYCEEHGLLSTGGSDLHTPVEDKFAVHLGKERWLDELLERVEIFHGA